MISGGREQRLAEIRDEIIRVRNIAQALVGRRVAKTLYRVADTMDWLLDELERAERLREGLAEVRLRHLYSAKEAGEGLAVWVLNGNDVADWQPKSGDFGFRSEQEYRERRALNERLAALSAVSK